MFEGTKTVASTFVQSRIHISKGFSHFLFKKIEFQMWHFLKFVRF